MRRWHVILFVVCVVVTTNWGCKGCNHSQLKEPAAEAADGSSSAEEPRSAVSATDSSLSGNGEVSLSVDDSSTDLADGGKDDQASNENDTAEGSGLPSSTDANNESTGIAGVGPLPRLADPKFKTPEIALRHAAAQRSAAVEHAAAHNYADAYSGILEAWQALQPHLSDARCRQRSTELLAEMEIYGEQLTTNSPNSISKPLKVN